MQSTLQNLLLKKELLTTAQQDHLKRILVALLNALLLSSMIWMQEEGLLLLNHVVKFQTWRKNIPFDPISEITFSNSGYICGTGDKFVKNQLELNCDIVDMEAYALAKICHINKIKFKCFKYISDYANEDSSNDWIENCHKGARDFLSLYPNCK